MKTFISSAIIFFVLLGMGSCVSTGRGKENNAVPSWAGMYSGVLPAADCPGISMVVILNGDGNGSDGIYKITYYYIDRDERLFTFTGKLSWDRAANLITLDSEHLPRYYKTGKDSLIQLDTGGKEITGELANHYKLIKVKF